MYGITSRSVIGTFYETLEAASQASWASKLAMMVTSNQDSETYRWLGMVPAMREWAGGRLAKGLRASGITIVNKDFEATLEILASEVRRDKTGQVRVRVQELADRAAAIWEALISQLITNGGTGLCYDGQYYFDTDHAEGASGTQVNALTNSHVPALDVTAPTAPTEAEFAAALMGVIGHILAFKDDQGEPLNANARNFAVMCPPNLYGPAAAAVAERVLMGATLANNQILSAGLTVQPILNPRLTATAVFYVFRTDGRAKPFICQEELPIEISALAEGSEEEFKHNRHLYGVKMAGNAGYGMWQHAAKATLS